VKLRALPPVYSPLSLGALAAGAVAALSSGAARRARAQVLAALQAEYAPRGVVLTDSGTSALALALRAAARLRPGPAALPAFCCYDIATATDAAGTPFLLYDVDPATLGPDRASLDRALSSGAGSVVAVHLYGIPIDLAGPATRLGGSAVLVEDAAQGVGVRIAGRPAGAIGSLGVLSFGRGKGTTAGRGGALLANDGDAAAAAAALEGSLDGPAAAGAIGLIAQWLLSRPQTYGMPASLPFLRLGDTVYRPAHPAGRLPDFGLGVLAQTEPYAAGEAEVRRTHARRLLAAAAAAPAVQGYRGAHGSEAGYLRFPLLLPDDAADAVRTGANRSLGIWPSYPRSLADLPGFGERRLNPRAEFPGARELARRLVTLPVHSQLGPDDLAALEQWIARVGQGKER
jgi:perosamine synthetase